MFDESYLNICGFYLIKSVPYFTSYISYTEITKKKKDVRRSTRNIKIHNIEFYNCNYTKIFLREMFFIPIKINFTSN